MSEEHLQASLEDLHSEVSSVENMDDHSQAKLDELANHIQLKLEEPDDPAHHESLTDQLSENISHFEVTHPDLTALMNRVLVTLSNTGI